MRAHSIYLAWLHVVLFLCVGHIPQVVQCSQEQVDFTDEQLQAMTDKELKQLCFVRGFDIVAVDEDSETGEIHEYSHDDFVQAARQCLGVEREMNELLAEHPELAEELDAEIARMEEEKEARKAQIEGLKATLEESGEPVDGENAEASSVDLAETTDGDDEKGADADSAETPETEAEEGTMAEGATTEASEDEDIVNEVPSGDDQAARVENAPEEEKATPGEAKVASGEKAIEKTDTGIVQALLNRVKRDVQRIIQGGIAVVGFLLRAPGKALYRLQSGFLNRSPEDETTQKSDSEQL